MAVLTPIQMGLKSQFKTLFGYELQTWQIPATEVFVTTNKDIVIKAPRGGRKSTWEDLMAVYTLVHKPNTFILIATVGIDPAIEHINRIRSFLLNSPFAPMISVPNNETEIMLTNGSRVLAIPQSADTRVGYHPNIKFIDETSRIDPKFYYSTLLPMGRGLNPPCRVINVSTPNGMHNVFAELWFNTPPNTVKIDVPITDCPWISKEELERERCSMPNLLFRQECLGEFVTDSGLPFSGVDRVVVNAEPQIDYSHNFVFGIDLARKRDFTVIVVVDVDANPPQVVWMERNQALWQTQIGLIKSLYEQFQPVSVYVDATGLGDVVVEELQEVGVSNLTPFIFTSKSKSEIVNNLVAVVENRQIQIPKKFEQLVFELKWFEWDKKDIMDDCVMALAMAMWAVRNPAKTEVFNPELYEKAFKLI